MDTYNKFAPEIKAILEAQCKKDGCEPTPANLIETLTEGEEVYLEDVGTHRWYHDLFKVVEVSGVLIGYTWALVTGDNSLSDTGWEFDLSSAIFVETFEVTETKYRKSDKPIILAK